MILSFCQNKKRLLLQGTGHETVASCQVSMPGWQGELCHASPHCPYFSSISTSVRWQSHQTILNNQCRYLALTLEILGLVSLISLLPMMLNSFKRTELELRCWPFRRVIAKDKKMIQKYPQGWIMNRYINLCIFLGVQQVWIDRHFFLYEITFFVFMSDPRWLRSFDNVLMRSGLWIAFTKRY